MRVAEYRCETVGCECEGETFEVEGRFEYGTFQPLDDDHEICRECNARGEYV